MRFLHTSDWHIGRTLHNVSLLQDQAYILEQLIEIAVAEQVQAIIVAGDIYDRSVPPASAVELLDKVVHDIIHTHNISLIIISGNHDSAQRIGFAARQLHQAGLYILSELQAYDKPVILQDKHGDVAFWGIPYSDPATVRSELQLEASTHDQVIQQLCANIGDHFECARNVAISHCFIDGASESESERPLSIGGADRVSWQHFDAFDYVALGHLHSRQYKGKECIRYCGSPLKYSFSEERHIKSATVIDMDESGQCAIKQLPLTPLRNLRSISGLLKDILNDAKNDPNNQDYILIRLTDTQAILNAMGKLREVYPNVLHLERTGLMAQREQSAMQPKQIRASEFGMFEDFFEQVMQRSLSADEAATVKETIESLQNDEDVA